MADKTRYPPGGVSAEAVREIRRMKARVDAERLPRGADPNTHTKLGRGGLADIEWTVQLLQLRYAHECLPCTTLRRWRRLDAIAAAELIAGATSNLLRRGMADRDPGTQRAGAGSGSPPISCRVPVVCSTPSPCSGLADYRDGGEFLDNYLRVTRRAKAVVRKVFGQLAFSAHPRFDRDTSRADEDQQEEREQKSTASSPLFATDSLRGGVPFGWCSRSRRPPSFPKQGKPLGG